MLSFHNDPSIKEKYLARVRYHREMDNIIQGTGWKNGKGCAVGCTLEAYDPARYPLELGIPEWLAYLEDAIFENLSFDKAKDWPELFLASIPVGVDLEKVKHKIAIRRLDNLIKIQNTLLNDSNENLNEIIKEVIHSIEVVKKCHESELNEVYCNWSAAAAKSAWSVAMAAAESAESVAMAAESVAAWSVAMAAESMAAWSVAMAAESMAWQTEADILIEELSNAK